MLRSMFSAISGLKAHQTKLDVAGNNIANVNTVGFKGSQVVFEDTLSQVLRNGSSPNGEVAGTNPAQVGLGVKVAGISTNFSQGSAQSTGRAEDFMITGDGFFVVNQGGENLYTRAGSFSLDGAGNFVTPDGAILQGWMAQPDGTVNTLGEVGPLKVQSGQVLAPVSTSGAGISGNLSATAAPGTPVTSQLTMFDGLGNPHVVSVALTKLAVPTPPPTTPVDQWQLTMTENGTTLFPAQTLDFSPITGQLISANPLAVDAPDGTYPSWAGDANGDVVFDLTGLTQLGGASSAAIKETGDSGSPLGILQSYSLSGDGTIVGLYSGGRRQAIGQLAMATFTNPGGLEKAGNSSYRAGDNSGNPLVGAAGTGGRGTLTAGSLEMSNVDLAEEFTGLIVAQRGFQANSRVITTSDEILQDLVQLKR